MFSCVFLSGEGATAETTVPIAIKFGSTIEIGQYTLNALRTGTVPYYSTTNVLNKGIVDSSESTIPLFNILV